MRRILIWGGVIIVVLAAGIYATAQVSPWPSALILRSLMDYEGGRIAAALEEHVTIGVSESEDARYDWMPGAEFKVYFPTDTARGKFLPTIVWVHGGGFFSGSRKHVAPYAQIIARQGYAVVTLDYALAPAAQYPGPVVQVNKALRHLVENAGRYRIDSERIILAGDSAGAQIAGQVANLITNPAYAAAMGITPGIERRRLIGAILHCGVYDIRLFRPTGGVMGWFLETAGWSYFGQRDVIAHPKLAEFSVIENATADFPPVFMSGGNADPLLPQSLALADALAGKGVRVERLFFPRNTTPRVPHEYQFNLDTAAGKIALERTFAFLGSLQK